jgi:DNA replication protein DnaC
MFELGSGKRYLAQASNEKFLKKKMILITMITIQETFRYC